MPGVKPHLLAVFTISSVLPLYLASFCGLPLMSLTVKSNAVVESLSKASCRRGFAVVGGCRHLLCGAV